MKELAEQGALFAEESYKDLEHELKVAEEFWDFLGGQGAYQELLDCYE